MWDVLIHPAAQEELDTLLPIEQAAVLHAVEKLIALGPRLSFPHQSHIEGSEGVRELRPRRGRSRWRAFYGQVGTTFVIAAIGPEAGVDNRAFARAIEAAADRLAALES